MAEREEEEEGDAALPSSSGRYIEDRAEGEEEEGSWERRKLAHIMEVSERLIVGDMRAKIEAAWDIRNLIRRSSTFSSPRTRTRFAAAGVIKPLVSMLFSPNLDARTASLLALLNLAARDESNKIKIVSAGALPPLLELLKFPTGTLRELATAAVLTLSSAESNKPIIISSGFIPFLVQILSSGSIQGRVDAVTALHYLSTSANQSHPILDSKAVSPLVNLLNECKKNSKFAEKTAALLEILCHTEEGRSALNIANDGILSLVETVEDGSQTSANHALAALVALCESSRDKYRGLILKQGAIPGLLWMTVEGNSEGQERAKILLEMLRDTPEEKKQAAADLERIAYDIAARVDGPDMAAETARELLRGRLKPA